MGIWWLLRWFRVWWWEFVCLSFFTGIINKQLIINTSFRIILTNYLFKKSVWHSTSHNGTPLAFCLPSMQFFICIPTLLTTMLPHQSPRPPSQTLRSVAKRSFEQNPCPHFLIQLLILTLQATNTLASNLVSRDLQVKKKFSRIFQFWNSSQKQYFKQFLVHHEAWLCRFSRH